MTVACVAFGQQAGTKSTEPAITEHWTLEAMATQARVVFKGTITEVDKIDYDPKPGQPQMSRYTLNIHVGERYKGSSDSWMTLDRVARSDDNRFELWKNSKTPMLFFRFSEEDPRPYAGSQLGPGLKLPAGQSWTAVHIGPVDAAEIAAHPSADKGALSMDLKVVSGGDAIVDAIKKFVKATPDTAKVFRAQVPASVTHDLGTDDGAQYVVLPVVPDIEATALKMINTPEAFLPKQCSAADKTCIRAAGVKALGGFQNA